MNIIQIDISSQIWTFRILFIIISCLLAFFMLKFTRDIYRKNSKYLANIFCSLSFLSYSISLIFYTISLFIFMFSGVFSPFFYKLLFVFIILGFFFLNCTLIIFNFGPSYLFALNIRILLFIFGVASFLPLIMPINPPNPPEYKMWTIEFATTIILTILIHSLMIGILYREIIKKLKDNEKEQDIKKESEQDKKKERENVMRSEEEFGRKSEIIVRFHEFGVGIMLLILGLYLIILSMAFNIFILIIIGYFLTIYSAIRFSKGIPSQV